MASASTDSSTKSSTDLLLNILLRLAVGIGYFFTVIQRCLRTVNQQSDRTAAVAIITRLGQVYLMIRINKPCIVAIIEHAHKETLFSITDVLNCILRIG